MNYPREIRLVIERLENSGFEAFLVGGALRDALLGREANDFDVTTSALPSEMQRVFSDFKTIETGLKHGTLTVLADGTANPRYVAADLLSQAEHDELASSILVTTSRELAENVSKEIDGFLKTLPR